MLNESSRDTISGTMTVDGSTSWLSFYYSNVFQHDLLFAVHIMEYQRDMAKFTTSVLISSILPTMQHASIPSQGQSWGQFQMLSLDLSSQ